VEFSRAVVHLEEDDISLTVAYTQQAQEDPTEAAFLFKARVLVYAATTWQRYATVLKGFVLFCRQREMSVFQCTPSVVNLYILKLAQDGSTISMVELFQQALSFLYKFYLMPNFAADKTVSDIVKFAGKVCEHRSNKKAPFGSAEVRQIFDKLMSKYKCLENLPAVELRTFVMAVLQHKTFCRFNEIAKLKLEDMLFHTDYFKIHIKQSKTDQQGKGDWVYVPKTTGGFLDAHMLCCVYLHTFKLDEQGPDMYLFPL